MSLRNYIRNKQLEYYRLADNLKSSIISGDDSPDIVRNLEIVEAKLTEINTIIEICEKRRKF